MKLGENAHMNIDSISTGCLGLDITQVGGVPKGRIIEIYEFRSSGKTTLAFISLPKLKRMVAK